VLPPQPPILTAADADAIPLYGDFTDAKSGRHLSIAIFRMDLRMDAKGLNGFHIDAFHLNLSRAKSHHNLSKRCMALNSTRTLELTELLSEQIPMTARGNNATHRRKKLGQSLSVRTVRELTSITVNTVERPISREL
jgi:hypothetical protein